jgi:hypothetical protein
MMRKLETTHRERFYKREDSKINSFGKEWE